MSRMSLNDITSSCSRCRVHKIKCTGENPCSNCTQRNVECEFQKETTQIQITRKRLCELHRKNRELERQNIALQEQLSGTIKAAAIPQYSGGESPVSLPTAPNIDSEPLQIQDTSEDVNIVNPLSSGLPEYISDPTGRFYYLGHTSTWSLTIRLLNLTHEALYNCPFPSTSHHGDSIIYDLEWNGLRSQAIPDIRGLPEIDHALFLINAAKFHTGKIFHLFDEERFMKQFHFFYESPAENIGTVGLWLPHFLVIIALGKAVVGTKSQGKLPPGSEFFRAAFIMLPDYSFLWKDPCTSAEILCAFALYLQSIDWRTSAHNMIGQALRILQVHGYHTDLSSRFTNEHDLARCQKVWWTVYVLERQISILMGTPLSVSDNDITAPFPSFPDSPLQTATLSIHVNLSKTFSRIMNVLYRNKGDPKSTFVKSTQEVLQRVAEVASDLKKYFPVPEEEAMSGISRVSGYLNLLYHQCIMLATRAFLFMLIEIRAKSADLKKSKVSQMEVPTPINLLLQICVESAKKTSQILEFLQRQNLLECFLPFDLESTVSASLVLTVASLINPPLIANRKLHLEALSRVLDQMVDQKNLVAADKKEKIDQLGVLCANLKMTPHSLVKTSISSQIPSNEILEDGLIPETAGGELDLHPQQAEQLEESREAWEEGIYEPYKWNSDISPSHLLEAADLLDGGNLMDWVDLPNSSFFFGNVD
ncbi:unnamed protein product [Penicillium salamii]|uniref:Zn(2)-C6 fungal-type domain-containing protein n=1 Tax=Penicillium salamii TaxID=1612424 RepID=A0A9W4JIQ2_9EURO|nr:unnamed protein product [Penicillium salamii]CAG8122466.1 unnamed protein product [Penicillium salamii]CAG8135496.1 unnamed protein product [Penicillium salamii]CAG8302666.1 unnamed protein product [Penicillium salamii]CAG8331156.1 unnamed protein product [Penicillium salamii]